MEEARFRRILLRAQPTFMICEGESGKKSAVVRTGETPVGIDNPDLIRRRPPGSGGRWGGVGVSGKSWALRAPPSLEKENGRERGANSNNPPFLYYVRP